MPTHSGTHDTGNYEFRRRTFPDFSKYFEVVARSHKNFRRLRNLSHIADALRGSSKRKIKAYYVGHTASKMINRIGSLLQPRGCWQIERECAPDFVPLDCA